MLCSPAASTAVILGNAAGTAVILDSTPASTTVILGSATASTAVVLLLLFIFLLIQLLLPNRSRPCLPLVLLVWYC